ncbi:hypothetical protein ACIPYQ_38260 [Streptomyces sp. NPDC090045]|uniref:hypothetical protein n=1 Tax=Streptomyces sp. NPDC090045 TaxID=3365927 RepID=UPI003819FE5B
MTSLVRVYDKDFRERASRKQSLGVYLLMATGAIWIWVAYLLLVPFTLGDGTRGHSNGRECASRVFYDAGDSGDKRTYADREGERCAAERDLADSLAWLLISLPFATIGLFHYTAGTLRLQMAQHASETTRLAAS